MSLASETDISSTRACKRRPYETQSPVRVCMHVLASGGVRKDIRVIREATALQEAGFVVTIVDVERSLPAEEEIQGIQVKHIVRPWWFVSARFKPWFLVKFLIMIMSSAWLMLRLPADVYHAQDQKSLPACFIAAWIRRKPLIFDAHELPLADESFTRWQRLHALAVRFLAAMLPYCAGVITVSAPIAQEIARRYRVPEVSLVRNVPAYQAIPKSDRLRQHLGVTQDVRIALYTGIFQPNRGLDRVIRAAAYVEQNILIVLMGNGRPETQAQLEALIISEGVADRVKILPPVPYEELLDWTASADMGLIVYTPDYSPNVRMCLPNKLFEYLMAGIPVLTSELDAVVEVVKAYDVGQVVSSLAPADVGATITAMLADSAALERMHRNALQVAQHELCWEKEKVRFIQMYQDMVEARNA